MHITQKDLEHFFVCPRKWLLSVVIRFSEDTLDAELMGKFDTGNILHKILELYMKDLQKDGKVLPVAADGKFENENEIKKHLTAITTKAFYDSEHNHKKDFSKKPLTIKILESQTENFVDTILKFLKEFCISSNFGGYKICAIEQKFSGKLGKEFFEKNESTNKNENEDKDLTDFDKWTFAGKIDCVLASDNGGIAIIDYKTSACPSAKSNKATPYGNLEKFQMSVYVTLWSAQDKKHKIPEKVFFASIKKNSNDSRFSKVICDTPKTPKEEYKQTLSVAHQKGKEFFGEINNSNIEVTVPRVKTYTHCKTCDFVNYCRTSYSASQEKLRYSN